MTNFLTADARDQLAAQALAVRAVDYVRAVHDGDTVEADVITAFHGHEPQWPVCVAQAEADLNAHAAMIGALADSDLADVGCPDCGATPNQRCRATCARYADHP